MELKTNWTSADTYNAGDLNRVERVTAQLGALLSQYGYRAILAPIYDGRTIESIEFADTLNRLEGNIAALHNAFAALPGYEPPKDWAAGLPFDFRDANRLETNLQLLDTWLANAVIAFRVCGTFRCGQRGRIT